MSRKTVQDIIYTSGFSYLLYSNNLMMMTSLKHFLEVIREPIQQLPEYENIVISQDIVDACDALILSFQKLSDSRITYEEYLIHLEKNSVFAVILEYFVRVATFCQTHLPTIMHFSSQGLSFMDLFIQQYLDLWKIVYHQFSGLLPFLFSNTNNALTPLYKVLEQFIYRLQAFTKWLLLIHFEFKTLEKNGWCGENKFEELSTAFFIDTMGFLQDYQNIVTVMQQELV